MHRLRLTATFLMLVAAVFLLWQYRFERDSRYPSLSLADFRTASPALPDVIWGEGESGPTVVVRKNPGGRPVTTRVAFPGLGEVDFLQVRFQVRARLLQPGEEMWEDGRCVIEWHPRSGEWENDLLASARQNHNGAVEEVVMSPEAGPARPFLRLENLGESGDFEIQSLETTALKERTVWRVGQWFLLAGWMAWVIACCNFPRPVALVRSLPVACIWLAMMLNFVIPGPWPAHRPFGGPFRIGAEGASFPRLVPVVASNLPAHVSAAGKSTAPDVASPPILKPVGDISDKSNFTLRLKLYAAKVKEILHVLMLVAPTFLTACLVRRRPALILSILFSFCVEAAQIAFGFGFDWIDAVDLVSDGAGILIALAAHRFLARRFPGWIET